MAIFECVPTPFFLALHPWSGTSWSNTYSSARSYKQGGNKLTGAAKWGRKWHQNEGRKKKASFSRRMGGRPV